MESGENQAPMLLTHWYVLKQGLIFSLLALPFCSGLALFLSRHVLRPDDRPLLYTEPSAPSPGKSHTESDTKESF